MPFFKQEDIDRVLSTADIADIIQRYIPLRPSGGNFKALCPFHHEKTPSFMVSRTKQIYHCFGCGAGGNVYSFVMNYEKVPFPEAVKIIADFLHISLSESFSNTKEKKIDFFGINKAALDFFMDRLSSDQGKKCRALLKKRGITEKTVKSFMIGFAPPGYDLALNVLKKKGFLQEDVVKAGVAVDRAAFDPGSSGGRVMDKFRNRIMFPVRNTTGKIIGFSGRCVDDNDIPKYLNTPETPVFRKREILYGFFEARRSIQEKGYALLMEGHIDVIMSHQSGIDNALGVQGTALTAEHVSRLKNYTRKVVMCFDGDSAGVEAVKKALPLFLENEMEAEAVLLPPGEDPASILLKSGKEGLKEHFLSRKPLFEFKLDNLKKNNNILIPEKKIDIIKDFFNDLKSVNNRVLRDEYFKKLASSLAIDEQALRKDFSDFRNSEKRYGKEPVEPIPGETVFPSGEIELLKVLVQENGFIQKLKQSDFSLELIQNEILRSVYDVLLTGSEDNINIKNIIVQLQDNPEAVKLLSRFATEDNTGEKEEIFQDCLQDVFRRNIRKRQAELKMAIKDKEARGDDISDLLSEFQSLIKQAKTKGCM